MGSRADDLARELEERRGRVSARINSLASRVESDATTVREDAKSRLPDRLDLSRQAHERPFSLLLGSLGVGTALGMLSESLSLGGGNGQQGQAHRGRDGHQQRDGQSSGGSGTLGRLMGGATQPLAHAMQTRIDDFAQQLMGGVEEGQRRQQERDPAQQQQGAQQQSR